MEVNMETAKVFKNGRSQAVRLPQKYRFDTKEVFIKKDGNKVILTPVTSNEKVKNFFSMPDFPDFEIDRKESQKFQERDLFWMKYMLDTDIASYLIKYNASNLSEKFIKFHKECCMSSITVAELKYGALKKGSTALISRVNVFCELIPIIAWDEKTANEYAKIRTQLELNGSPIGAMDTMIAASAKENNCILITNNTKHFSCIPNLKIDNWL